MKNITDKTILKQGNKIYQPIKVGDNIIWYESNDFDKHHPKAQSIQYFKDVPVISLDSPVKQLLNEFKETHEKCLPEFKIGIQHAILRTSCYLELEKNQYTQQDIERALSLAFMASQEGYDITTEEILEQINSISEIEVDDQFNIISYL